MIRFPLHATLSFLFLASVPFLLQADEPGAGEKTSEVAAGKAALFDGKSLAGWTTADGKEVTAGWVVEEGGILHRKSGGGDIFTAAEYGDFTLEFEWKISEGGNSGLKYKFTTYGKARLGLEYQLLDDAKHPDGKIGPHRQTAALYDILPAPEDKAVKAVGEWNMSKIVVSGSKIEHWLNGKLTISFDTSTEEWKAAVAKSKFKNNAGFGQSKMGKIMLQDHGDEVWFRNLTIETPAAEKQSDKKE